MLLLLLPWLRAECVIYRSSLFAPTESAQVCRSFMANNSRKKSHFNRDAECQPEISIEKVCGFINQLVTVEKINFRAEGTNDCWPRQDGAGVNGPHINRLADTEMYGDKTELGHVNRSVSSYSYFWNMMARLTAVGNLMNKTTRSIVAPSDDVKPSDTKCIKKSSKSDFICSNVPDADNTDTLE
ncbi:uncharacterized protein LOC105694764 [Orussus abietinus]|uniref:uncharacterized protein LOC105694764 n=1 Tax=Orussus abietinus TaxID=222816 RepID=UPI00062572BD|nr:uncharacterized protein LOC105694764 [Orussus abietinus]